MESGVSTDARNWAEEVLEALKAESRSESGARDDLLVGATARVVIETPIGLPLGHLSSQLAEIDRVFRYVARLSELEESFAPTALVTSETWELLNPEQVIYAPEMLTELEQTLPGPEQHRLRRERRQRRPTIPRTDGLILEEVRPGSAHFELDLAGRLQRLLERKGVKAVLAICTLIAAPGAVIEAVNLIEGGPPPAVTHIELPAHGGVDVQAPGRTSILLTKDGNKVMISVTEPQR